MVDYGKQENHGSKCILLVSATKSIWVWFYYADEQGALWRTGAFIKRNSTIALNRNPAHIRENMVHMLVSFPLFYILILTFDFFYKYTYNKCNFILIAFKKYSRNIEYKKACIAPSDASGI